MNGDFVSGLRAELVSAAERRERRLAARLPSMRPIVPILVVAAAVVAALLVVELSPNDGTERPAGRPTGDVRPLYGGSLEPGERYGSVALVPAVSFAVGDDRWLAKFTEDSDFLLLEREEPRDAAGGVTQARSWFSVSRPTGDVYDVRSGKLVPRPDDFGAWLRAHPDVDATQASGTDLGGLRGEVFDLRFHFTKASHPAPECRYTGLRCTALGPGDFHADGARARVYVLDSDPGPLLVWLEGLDDQSFRALEQAARPLLDSLQVTRP
jgi:hypothetical protein